MVLAALLIALLLLGVGLNLIYRLKRENHAHQIALARLHEHEQLFRLITENTRDIIWVFDLDSRHFSYISPSVESMSGYRAEEVMDWPLEELMSPASWQHVQESMADNLRLLQQGDTSQLSRTVEIQQRHRDGHLVDAEIVTTYVLNEQGKPISMIGITRDISTRKQHELLLQEQAIRDGLTGLYNRRYLDETLPRELARVRRDSKPLAIIMADLDFFKRVNDTHGHDAGDEVLRQFAALLRQSAREGDIACRYGGEEFILVMPGLNLDSAFERSEALRTELASKAITVNGTSITITISAGIAMFPTHSEDADTLIKYADLALYQAKHRGRNRTELYSSDAVQGTQGAD